jgi:hypothetical protein
MTPRLTKHSRRHIQRYNERAPIPTLQLRSTATRPRAKVKHDVWFKLEQLESPEQFLADPRLQNSRRLVLRTGAIK